MKPIFLDNNSTTKLDPRVLETMLPCMERDYGNPSSTEHVFGWDANDLVNNSREKISNLIRCSPNDIIFTSGATESNNISILGVLNQYWGTGDHAITIKTEHKSILDIFSYAETQNMDVSYLDVQSNGIIDIDYLSNQIKSNTRLISVMMANNEIGVIQPITEISNICSDRGIILHIDAAQALGKIDIDLNQLDVDLMSLSAHKIYGPKGVGCIYINRERMKNKICPIFFGGGHEQGLRPGTLAVPTIVGFGKSCEIYNSDYNIENKRVSELTDMMLSMLSEAYPNIIINGDMEKRIPGNLNLSFPGLSQEALIKKLTMIAVSSGSACTTSTPSPSHVLKALGVNDFIIKSTIRLGIGRFNTKEEIINASNHIIEVVNKLNKNKVLL